MLDYSRPEDRYAYLLALLYSPCQFEHEKLVSPLSSRPCFECNRSLVFERRSRVAHAACAAEFFFRCSRNFLRNHRPDKEKERGRKREVDTQRRYLSTTEDSKIIREMKPSDENKRRVLFQGLLLLFFFFFFFFFKGK